MMKAALIAAVAAQLVSAHYTFPDLISGSTVYADWQYVRRTDNYQSNGPVTDVTSASMKCYESATAAQTSTLTVSAGSVVGFKANTAIYHPGYYDAYLSPANPTANTESAGNGKTWFKIWEDPPTWTPGSRQLDFPQENLPQFTFTIPKDTPSGQYLVRGEHIALHSASTFGGAQLYIACGQLNIINGGNGVPGPLVSIPGVYTGYEPGILINIYSLPANYTGYVNPGPAPWTGGVYGGGSPPPPASSTSTSVAPPTTYVPPPSTVSSKSSSSSVPPTTTKTTSTWIITDTGAAHYAQCGGQGWTGPTVCAPPYTCKVSNQYYSQCL